MKKNTLHLIISLLCCFALWSAPVTPESAILAAKNFDASMNGSTERPDIQLVYTAITPRGINAFYIFNIDDRRFVIVAAEDRQEPILAYDFNASFDVRNISPEILYFFENYGEEIQFIIDNNIEPESTTTEQWQMLLSDSGVPLTITHRSTTVGPLLSTCWGQGWPDNSLCPTSGSCQAVSGCVATAMSQIMNYWQYPLTGDGSNSYFISPYGTLAANFGATTYTWTGSAADRGRIMSDTGISVNMQYSCSSSGAWVLLNDQSGFHPRAAQNSYTSHFRYDTGIQGVRRTNYSYNNWKDLLRNELNNSRPIQYAGWGNSGGHTWVCDGYHQNFWGTKFHMNWGWNCSNNGMYRLGGIGGNQSDFPSNEQALINIKPAPCPSNVSITGTYSNTITQSGTWIVSNSTTIIPSGSTVRLDADPANGFVLLTNGFETQSNSLFIAQALDGCGAAIPSRPIIEIYDTADENVSKEMRISDIKVYPNPTNGMLNVEYPISVKELKLYDIVGKLLLTKTVSKERHALLDLTAIPSGIYFLSFDGQSTKKIVKE
ncbi:thiol protease/hemagglutinin PrtT [Flavobacterium sp.]|uniref:thiol protease/hemagglutinin PrtT n=1 Tax=Flavobacterium sp. TaxID=239 RepID=UPI003D6A52AD